MWEGSVNEIRDLGREPERDSGVEIVCTRIERGRIPVVDY